jgi:hypothetical protein
MGLGVFNDIARVGLLILLVITISFIRDRKGSREKLNNAKGGFSKTIDNIRRWIDSI